MPESPAPQDRAAFRAMPIGMPPFSVDAELPGLPAEIRAAGFSPIAGRRIEITGVFECVCDGSCPRGCIHCIACSGRPAEARDSSEENEDR